MDPGRDSKAQIVIYTNLAHCGGFCLCTHCKPDGRATALTKGYEAECHESPQAGLVLQVR